MQIDKAYVLATAERLLKIDSPTGFTRDVMQAIEALAGALGYVFTRTNKGNGILRVEGKDPCRTVGVCAHVDTLGLMVRSIKGNGKLAITRVGGPLLPTLDGEYCTLVTREGKRYTGTILCDSPAAHVFDDAATKERNEKSLEIRLDEMVRSAEDVKALGIGVGDYICIDPKTVITPSGFIKSRFLDDKLSVAVLFGVLKALKDAGEKPRYTTLFMISTYEEVGHGMAYLPEKLEELLAVDMGCIGDDLSCSEYDVSICVKDSTGPYDYELTSRLIALAKGAELSFAADVYPHYGSDVSAARDAGNDVRGALIGPGVDASHGMERSHYAAVENTVKLVWLYLVG